MLDVAHRTSRLFQWRLALESVKSLNLLERILLHAGAHALLKRLMQIHQHARAQHAVDLVFARCMHAHQALHRSRLIRAEVIHMHLRIGSMPVHDFVYEPLEALLFLVAVQRPAFLVSQFAARAPCGKTE